MLGKCKFILLNELYYGYAKAPSFFKLLRPKLSTDSGLPLRALGLGLTGFGLHALKYDGSKPRVPEPRTINTLFA